ncbi:hypothetical protein BDV59DRAFT_86869 [Aspergillus ambiguus]|uniref:uncharacterized protein n=1 Tax=Aspergillus ambiguus TaxID=176160 RepID=UPI003CCE3501
MCPMLLNSLSDGPAMVLSPPQEHAFLPYPRQSMMDAAADTSSGAYFANGFHSHTSFSSGLAAPAAKPSRKRSREEADFEEARNVSSMPPLSATVPPAPQQQQQQEEEEPIYGEGMVLLNPRTKMALSAESQTGTWYEENMTAPSTAPSQPQSQAAESGRKSQRLDPSAPSLDDITVSSIQRQQDAANDDNRRLLDSAARSNPFTPGEPLVDDATRLLGISWQRIAMDDADLAAAVRGWKKYIDRQFAAHLADCQILMKNRALNAYLVAARPAAPLGVALGPAFYLFNDELTQAQLVGSSWETCVQNLRATPIMFEGTQVLNASDRPLDAPASQVQNQNLLGMNPVDAGLPLLQTLSAQPSINGIGAGMAGGVGMGSGMEIDA